MVGGPGREGAVLLFFPYIGDKHLGCGQAVCARVVVPEEPYCYRRLTEMPVSEPSPVGVWRRRPGAGEEICALEWTQRG